MNLIRLFTAGNVDDGKSTLIGRLLLDSGAVSTDIIQGLTKAQKEGKEINAIDLAFLTDGLRAERELGITIDVAYKYFSSSKNKYIIADTPGHWEYTRNMFTGASLCDVAIILVDATVGITEQTKRHSLIASLVGVNNVVFAINKMDLKNYDQTVFDALTIELNLLAGQLNMSVPSILPISALLGENVVHKSSSFSWFEGPTLFDYLENNVSQKEEPSKKVLFQIQYLINDGQEIAYAGRIEQGTIREGQVLLISPQNQKITVKKIINNKKMVNSAKEGNSIAIYVEQPVELDRGAILSDLTYPPIIGRRFTAVVCWMSEINSDFDKDYLLQIGAVNKQVKIVSIQQKQLKNKVNSANLTLNDIAIIAIESKQSIVFDTYNNSKSLGSFIFIDAMSFETVGAGIILG